MMAYCDASFASSSTSVLPLLHRTVSGIAISPIGGHVLPLLHRTVSGIAICRLEGMCTFIRNDGLLAFFAFSS
jgi:tetrahydromethanopterin S-methyltransferase subunit C